ncbi:MAG TPA: hypothetical protein PKV80_12805, partial [Leptospiraceae bacterium]|nr:hypothetical protein [Leptospiraceae bacterium]
QWCSVLQIQSQTVAFLRHMLSAASFLPLKIPVFKSTNPYSQTIPGFPILQAGKMPACSALQVIRNQKRKETCRISLLCWFSKHTAGRGLSGRFAKLFKTAAQLPRILNPCFSKCLLQVFLQSVSH